MKLQNYMEDIVVRTVNEIINQYDDICKCEKCRMDIAAIALNNLPPKYIVTKEGELFTKINEMKLQFEVDVLKEVTRAIEIVINHPLHNDYKRERYEKNRFL